ncbi:MAG: class I SAM-dependent methyltransferase [Myxococcales bacterium]|nr:class I SAM-dependent methyltransferase [Myxococcales bacterium]
MGFYERQVLPRLIDWSLGTPEILAHRQRVTAGLAGAVVEIGFGSGLNVPFLPASVTRLYGIDPCEVGRGLAAKRIAQTDVAVEFAGLDGQRIELPDASADMALSTFTLCTIPDAHAALEEVKRVLRPGGVMHFLEHGRSPDAGVARWQDRLNPMHRRIGGGCNLNRTMDVLVRDAGFELIALENFSVSWPRPYGYMYMGRARRA